MKITIQYVIIGVLVVALIAVYGIMRSGTEESTLGTQVPVNNTENQVVKTPVATPKTTVKSGTTQTTQYRTTTVQPASSQNVTYQSYANTVTQLAANQNACRTAAEYQFKQLYAPILGSSSYTNAYNSNSGMCYSQVSGTTHIDFSTSTTGHLYFRNVTRNTVIAECTDPTGQILSDINWSCVNKQTGQSMNKAQYNAYVATVTTQ